MTLEPMSDTDNKFIGLGLSLGWDNRYKRVLITKDVYKRQLMSTVILNALISMGLRLLVIRMILLHAISIFL